MRKIITTVAMLALGSVAAHAQEIRYEPSYQREMYWGPDRREPRYDASWSCEAKWGPRICARERRERSDRQ
jgi:hypothetical protein